MSGSRSRATPRPDAVQARPVSKRGDRHEREADRAADVVSRGGSVAGWSFAAVPTAAPEPVQRQEVIKEKTDEEKKKEVKEKTTEAVLKTPQVEALKEKVLADPVVKTVKDAVTSTPGLIATGAAAAGGVAALAATGKELPMQPPEIPLDKIKPGMSAQVTYEGPVNAPTFVGLSVTFKEQGPKGKGAKKAGPIAADIARLKAQREMFRPAEEKAAERQQEQEFVNAWVARQQGFTIPLPTPQAEKKEEVAPAQPAPASPAAAPPTHANVDGAFSASGRPLDPSTRRAMETRFGYDFSGVRVHDDARAAATAASIDAAAFTVGEDIAFAAGRYDATGEAGRRLLAHELTHVAQQRSRGARVQRKAEPAVSLPGDPAEREADETADRVVAGLPATEAGLSEPAAGVQRQETPDEEADEWVYEGPEVAEDEAEAEVQASRSSGPAVAPAGFSQALAGAGAGAALPAGPRRTLEGSFGADFANVRLHRDGASERLAASIGAEAFTVGPHVHFAARAPDPATPAGLRLLAHELTHVRQQARSGSRGRVVQRSRALYFSTRGDQEFFRHAGPFHRDRGFPDPVMVSSIEELLEHLVTLSKPIESVRLVTHAVPAGINLPILRGAGQSLFPADLALQGQEALESELVTEHQTNVHDFKVTEKNFHVVPQSWARFAYDRVTTDSGGKKFLQSRKFPDKFTQGGDLETLIWWVLDAEAVLAKGERPVTGKGKGKGKTELKYLITGIPDADRPAVAQNLERNADIYAQRVREHLLLRHYPKEGTDTERRPVAAAAVSEFLRRLRAISTKLIDEQSQYESFSYASPTQRYGAVQGALERGTFSNNVLFAKVAIANGMPFEIRGCRIGQNPTWLGLFRDFWGLGAGPTQTRPDVSAPDLRQIFGWRRRRGSRTRETAEWLEGPRGRHILGGTAEFESHIIHAR